MHDTQTHATKWNGLTHFLLLPKLIRRLNKLNSLANCLNSLCSSLADINCYVIHVTKCIHSFRFSISFSLSLPLLLHTVTAAARTVCERESFVQIDFYAKHANSFTTFTIHYAFGRAANRKEGKTEQIQRFCWPQKPLLFPIQDAVMPNAESTATAE